MRTRCFGHRFQKQSCIVGCGALRSTETTSSSVPGWNKNLTFLNKASFAFSFSPALFLDTFRPFSNFPQDFRADVVDRKSFFSESLRSFSRFRRLFPDFCPRSLADISRKMLAVQVADASPCPSPRMAVPDFLPRCFHQLHGNIRGRKKVMVWALARVVLCIAAPGHQRPRSFEHRLGVRCYDTCGLGACCRRQDVFALSPLQ